MKRNTKKGFTLTELLIVIVIIAILLAVLIPVLTSYVKRARVATEKEIVKNVNLALSRDEEKLKTGKNHATMHEALKVAFDYGYDIALINEKSKTGYEILWDSKNDVFCYLNKENDKIEYIPEYQAKDAVGLDEQYMYWQIKKVESNNDLSDKYSVYATSNSTATTITTDKGFDVGNNTTITSINYNRPSATDERKVVIRTNSFDTNLTINAPLDTVKHYDKVGSLNIIAVASASYHENGQVAFAEIATGRIVLESDSKVEHIHLTATGGNFVDITVAKASNVEMPEFSRDPVEIPAEGKLVVALQDGTDKDDDKDYVWLTAVGIYEQVTVSDSKDDAKNNYAATSTTASQEQKTTAQQIANNITFEAAGEDYKVTAKTTDGGATWTYEVVDQNGTVSEDYSAEKHNTKNTVEVKTSGENPEVVDTTTENGLNKESKDNLKDDLVITAKADEQIGEQLLGIKTVSINNESIDVYLPVNTSDGSLDLDDIKSSTLVPFNFNFAGGVSFIAPESINEEWNNATADFVISFNKDIDPITSFNYRYNNDAHEASSENYKILPVIGVGKFGNNATSFWEKYKNMWLPCPITSDGYKANEEIALLHDVFASVGFDGVSVNCEELVNYIKEFSCGLVFLQDIGEVTITVKLVVTNNNTKYVVGSQQFTFNSADYVTTCPSGTYPAE